MTSGISLNDEGDSFSNLLLYRTLIGFLQYLMYTRPGIAFVVNKLNQFLSTPKMQHWLACKRLLRYLKQTVGLGLLFSPSPNDLSLLVYTNADHVGCKVTRRSTSGLCVYFDCNLVVWGSRKQTVVARSVGEAEHRAIAQGVIELLWLKQSFSKLGYPCSTTTRPIVWSNNLAAKSIAENLIFHARIKHIKINVHFVREKVMSLQLIKQLIFLQKGCQEIDFSFCVESLGSNFLQCIIALLALQTLQ